MHGSNISACIFASFNGDTPTCGAACAALVRRSRLDRPRHGDVQLVWVDGDDWPRLADVVGQLERRLDALKIGDDDVAVLDGHSRL